MTDAANATEVPPPAPVPGAPPAALPDVSELKAAPLSDVDSLQPKPTVIRGLSFPAAAVARFAHADGLTRIFANTATKAADGYAQSFAGMTAADQQTMIDAGIKPGDFNSVGGVLRFAKSAFGATADVLQDGFLAIGPAVSQGAQGFGEQLSKETGIGDPERVGREFGGIAEATMADVGDQGTLAATGPGRALAEQASRGAEMARAAAAAEAQLKEGGVYSHAYRVDPTPGGGLTDTSLGRIPTAAEAVEQAKVVATHLGLPEETGNLIHKTYVETGRPPSEVLMDAKTNAGGVLGDLVNGKVPEVYKKNLATYVTPANTEPGSGGVAYPGIPAADMAAQPPSLVSPPRAANTGEMGIVGGTDTGGGVSVTASGVSKIGKSVEAKAIEDGLTEGFSGTALYDKAGVKEQAGLAASLINGNLDTARAVLRGEQPLPGNLRGISLITGMEKYVKQNPSADLAYEIANSPLISGTSTAAAEMRLAQERTPDSATAALQQVKDAIVKKAGGPQEVAARRAAVKQLLPEASKLLLPKEELSWDRFLESIKC